MDRNRECRHQKNIESYNTDEDTISCCKFEHCDHNQTMSYGHKVGKHTQQLTTEYIRVEDGVNIIASAENHETHAHCVDIYRTVQHSRLYQSDKTIIRRLNTSHHMDDTSSILTTYS
eukprot:9058936-Heterocapsa_arctica.AAC.1